MYIDKKSYIETPAQAYNPGNWRPLGIEAVVKGGVSGTKELTVTINLYDTFEIRPILSKQYQAQENLIRQMAHNIANDVYTALTGTPGIFRTKIAFVAEDDGEKGIHLMDWDGQRARKMGLKGRLMLSPRWSSDGSKIIYSSERSRQWGLYLLDFLKMSEKRVFVSRGTNLAGDFFPQGDKVVFSASKDGTPDLYTVSLKDSSLKSLLHHMASKSHRRCLLTEFYRFVSDRGGSPQLYLMRSDGSEIKG
jgi:TolB protein